MGSFLDILENEAFATPPSKSNIESFVTAAGTGDIGRVRAFIDSYPAYIDSAAYVARKTALMASALTGQRAVFDLLLAAGADMTRKDGDGMDVMFYAILNHDAGMIDALTDRGMNINHDYRPGLGLTLTAMDIVELLKMPAGDLPDEALPCLRHIIARGGWFDETLPVVMHDDADDRKIIDTIDGHIERLQRVDIAGILQDARSQRRAAELAQSIKTGDAIAQQPRIRIHKRRDPAP